MKIGRYEGRIVDACVGHAKSGTLQVELLLEIENGEKTSWFGSLSPKAMPYTVEALKLFGLKDGQGPEVVIGKNCSFEVYEDTYNGKTTHKVKLFTRTWLMTKKKDRMIGKEAASILFPKPYQPRINDERQPGDDDDMPF
jgi:hypothetical protein